MSFARTMAGLINTAGDVKASAVGDVGLTVYSTLDSLPTSSLTAGDQAYVSSNRRFYISNGSGWYNVALANASPSLTVSNGTVTLATDGVTPTVITLTATDSDNPLAAITYTVESDGNFVGLATLSQDSSVFTITPLSEGSATTTSSTLTFKASDGISFGTGTTVLSLSFGVDWTTATETVIGNSWGSSGNGDYLGMYQMSISGNGQWLAIPSYRIQRNGQYTGGCHIFERVGNSWTYRTVLTANEFSSATESLFAAYADLNYDGSILTLSGTAKGVNEGDLWIFTRTGSSWAEYSSSARDLAAWTAISNEYLGQNSRISGDGSTIVMGQRGWASGIGAVRCLRKTGSTWAFANTTPLSVSGTGGNTNFGFSVDIDSDASTIVAGWTNVQSSYVAAVYSNKYNGTEDAFLTDNDYKAGYTSTVCISGDGTQIAVAQQNWDNGGTETNKGKVTMYYGSGSSWTKGQTLTGSLSAANGFFGSSLTMDRNGLTLLVGAYSETVNVGGIDYAQGRMYAFTRDSANATTWNENATFTSSLTAKGSDRFGWTNTITSDGTVALVNAAFADSDFTNSGAVFEYRL